MLRGVVKRGGEEELVERGLGGDRWSNKGKVANSCLKWVLLIATEWYYSDSLTYMIQENGRFIQFFWYHTR